MNCQICNKPNANDLFSAVTGEPVCSICKLRLVGGLPSTPERIKSVRDHLGLKDGEYLQYDHGKVASEILGWK